MSACIVRVHRQEENNASLVVLRVPSAFTAAGETVVAMTVSCEGHLLSVCTSEKRLVVWECDTWTVRGER